MDNNIDYDKQIKDLHRIIENIIADNCKIKWKLKAIERISETSLFIVVGGLLVYLLFIL